MGPYVLDQETKLSMRKWRDTESQYFALILKLFSINLMKTPLKFETDDCMKKTCSTD